MPKDTDRPPLSRPLRVAEIEDGESGEIEATPSEMAAIAALLDLQTLTDLTFAYQFRQGDGGRLHLSGRLKANVTQTCVVSLDPVNASLDVPVEAEFWPEELIARLEQSPEHPGHAGAFDWPEPIVEGKIDLGPLIYENFATALDPYPKREGASFEWSQGDETAPEASGPFAALEALKRR